jgi:integrase
VSETTLVQFFSYLFEKHGFKYAKLQSIRSALALPLRLACGLQLGKLVLLQQTLAGIRRVIPPSRPPLVSWDLDTVLQYLQSSQCEPLREKPPDVIFAKSLFLVALTTGLRVSELCSLGSSQSFLQFHRTGCSFKFLPTFLAKHEHADALRDHIWLPSIAHTDIPIKSKVLCPVRALNIYVDASSSSRSVLTPLFLHPSLHTPLTPSVLSKFLAATIRRATVTSLDRVSAHDVRAVAAALQWRRNQNWDKLKKVFSWRQKSAFIRTYSRGFTALS